MPDETELANDDMLAAAHWLELIAGVLREAAFPETRSAQAVAIARDALREALTHPPIIALAARVEELRATTPTPKVTP